MMFRITTRLTQKILFVAAFMSVSFLGPGIARAGIQGFDKEITSGPDEDGDGEIDLVVEVGQTETTEYDFTITQSGLAGLLIVDTVPAEWDVVGVVTNDQFEVFKTGRGKRSNSSTKILWRPASASSSLLVFVQTRQSPSGKVKFAPTESGALCLNSGPAQAFEVDPETGEPLRDPETGEKLPPVFEAGPLCLAAVED